jgi:hypothetical protein
MFRIAGPLEAWHHVGHPEPFQRCDQRPLDPGQRGIVAHESLPAELADPDDDAEEPPLDEEDEDESDLPDDPESEDEDESDLPDEPESEEEDDFDEEESPPGPSALAFSL